MALQWNFLFTLMINLSIMPDLNLFRQIFDGAYYQAPSKTVGEMVSFLNSNACVDGGQTEFSASGHLSLKERPHEFKVRLFFEIF